MSMENAIDPATYDAPGIIREITDYTDGVAYSPNRPLAFAGAVGLLAHFMGHGYRDLRGTTPNLMIVALAPSGVGKEMLRETNRRLASAFGRSVTLRGKFASGQGIEDTLAKHPCALYQVDEIHFLMEELAAGRTLANQKSEMLLELYSQAGSIHTMRDKAVRSETEGGPGGIILEPRLTVIGTGTPRFYDAINARLLEDGLMGRFLIVEGDKLADDNFDCHTKPFSETLMAGLKDVLETNFAAGTTNGYVPRIVPDAPDAVEPYRDAIRAYTALARAAETEGESVPMALWARAKDKFAKLALVFAVSRDPKEPRIELEDIRRADTLVRHSTETLLARAALHVHDTPFQADCQKVLRLIARKDKGEGVTHREVSQRVHFEPSRLMRVIHGLVENESIRVVPGPRGGNVYVIVA